MVLYFSEMGMLIQNRHHAHCLNFVDFRGSEVQGMHLVSQSVYYCSESGDCYLSVDNYRGSCKI